MIARMMPQRTHYKCNPTPIRVK